MPVATPLFIITLDEPGYTAMLNKTGGDGLAVAAARRDPKLEFDDQTRTIRVGYDWRTMVGAHTPFRRFIKMYDFKQAMQSATPAFRKQIDDAIDKARDACRTTFDPPGFVEPPTPKVDPKASNKSVATDVLSTSPGLAIGRQHKDGKSVELFTEMLSQEGKPVDIMFIEELRAEEQDELDAYLGGPDDAEMGPGLRKRVDDLRKQYSTVDLESVLVKAKQKGVKVYGIDTAECEPGVDKDDPTYGEKRDVVMNAFAADVVKKALTANPDAKYMLACGEAHLNSHMGGVPGLAQMLGIPGMRVSEEGKLRAVADQKSLRRMPGKAEQAFIDAALIEAGKQYVAIPQTDRDPRDMDPAPVRATIERLSREFVRDGALTVPGDAAGLLNDPKTKAAIAAACESNKGRTRRVEAMTAAIETGKAADLRKLLAEDRDVVRLVDELTGRTLLHAAAKSGSAEMIEMLIEAGGNPNAVSTAGLTPMHEACTRSGDAREVKRGVDAMMDAGGDLSIPNANCQTSLDLVRDRKDPALFTSLLEDGHGDIKDLWIKQFEKKAQDDYEESGRTPQDHEELNAGELRKLAIARFEAMSALTRIVDANDVTEVLNVDDESEAAISEMIKRTKARKQRRREMLGAIGNDDDGTVIGRIIKDDPLFTTLGLSEGKTALDMAALDHKNQAMMSLLRAGVDPNHVNERNQTTLLEVCKKEVDKDGTTGKASVHETAGILLDLGADPNVADRFGCTPLHYAGQWNNAELIGSLADKGADPGRKDERGWTPLDMTQASTCKEAEKAFFETGMAKPETQRPKGKHSTVDLLCMATKVSNGPEDELKLRKMYEKLYAMETMRPILDLAAASTCNGRNPPKGGLKIFATDKVTTGDLLGKPSGGSMGAYDEKVNSLLLATKSQEQEGEISGTLAHELTHLTAHLITDDESTVPFKPGDDKGKQEYLRAIEGDVKRVHLLSDSDPAQKFVRSQISGRMTAKGYAKKRGMETDFSGADERLMQEHVVSVPQLMAAYGEAYVSGKAPNLTAYFKDLSKRAADTLQNDPRFATGRDAIDTDKNDRMVQRLEKSGVAPKPPEAKTLNKNSDDFNVDKIIERLRAGITAQHGTMKKRSVTDGPSIAHAQDDFELDEATKKMVDKRLTALKKVLTTTMSPDRLAGYISSEAMPQLLEQLGSVVHGSPDDKTFLKGAAITSDTWSKKTKIDFVKARAQSNLEVKPEDLASAVVFEAEMRARGGSSNDDEWAAAALETGQSKQKKAIEALAEELSKTENEGKLKKPAELLRLLPQAVVDPGADAIRVKTKPKRFGRRRDQQHVSIDVKNAKRLWVQALGKIAA